jgi:hypothetical protein
LVFFSPDSATGEETKWQTKIAAVRVAAAAPAVANANREWQNLAPLNLKRILKDSMRSQCFLLI